MAAMKKAAVKITGTAKSTGGNMRSNPMKKAAAKKADPMKTSAKSHQKDLANISGEVQGKNKGKGKIGLPGSPSFNAAVKAIIRAEKSFK